VERVRKCAVAGLLRHTRVFDSAARPISHASSASQRLAIDTEPAYSLRSGQRAIRSATAFALFFARAATRRQRVLQRRSQEVTVIVAGSRR